MQRGNRLCNTASLHNGRPQLSCTVRAISHVGECLASGACLFFLISAAMFSAVTRESFAVQAMTFVVFGLLPAFVVCSAHYLILSMVRWGCEICPSVAAVLWAVGWRAFKFALFIFSEVALPLVLRITLAGKRGARRFGLMWLRAMGICGRAVLSCARNVQHAAARLYFGAYCYAGVTKRHFVAGVTFPIRFCAKLLLKLEAQKGSRQHQAPISGLQRAPQRAAGLAARAGRTPRLERETTRSGRRAA
jgi:hypothetical protein